MKNTYYLILLLLCITLGCQRDDICSETTATTPRLIIRFYENVDPFDLQAPQNLSIKATDVDDYVTNNGTVYYRYSQDSIAIPLKTNDNTTEYIFTLNTRDTTNTSAEDLSITDTIRFAYSRDEQYLNRACAFKVNYNGLSVNTTQNWIERIQVVENTVEDEIQAHVSIFF